MSLRLLNCLVAFALVSATKDLDAQAPDSLRRPFQTWTRLLPYRRGVVVWLRNISPDTLLVTRVTASKCLNIGAGCGATDLQLRVAPQDSAPALTLRPRVWDDRYVYQLSWDWEIRTALPRN